MGLHRLLIRGFASLYGYTLPQTENISDLDVLLGNSARPGFAAVSDENEIKDMYHSALQAGTERELHYKMQGARFFP